MGRDHALRGADRWQEKRRVEAGGAAAPPTFLAFAVTEREGNDESEPPAGVLKVASEFWGPKRKLLKTNFVVPQLSNFSHKRYN
jgi:hypothetical protein